MIGMGFVGELYVVAAEIGVKGLVKTEKNPFVMGFCRDLIEIGGRVEVDGNGILM